MGRPIKYLTPEARLEARRLQTRAHVRLHRARQRLKQQCWGALQLDEASLQDDEEESNVPDALKLLRLNVDVEASDLARESFHNFRFRVTKTLFWRSFWQDTVLPACHAEPAILNATLALSALQLRAQVVDGARAASLSSSAMLHSSKASGRLRCLSAAADNLAIHIEVALITSIIFAFTAYLIDDIPTAAVHVTHGLRMLEDFAAVSQHKPHGCSRSRGQVSRVTVLADILRQLSLRALLLDDELVPPIASDATIDIPRSFEDVPQSWNTVSAITLKLINEQRRAISSNTVASTAPGLPTIKDLLVQWHKAWIATMAKLPPCERSSLKPWETVPFDVARLIVADEHDPQSATAQLCCARIIAAGQSAPPSWFEGTDRLSRWPLELVLKRALNPKIRAEALMLLNQQNT